MALEKAQVLVAILELEEELRKKDVLASRHRGGDTYLALCRARQVVNNLPEIGMPTVVQLLTREMEGKLAEAATEDYCCGEAQANKEGGIRLALDVLGIDFNRDSLRDAFVAAGNARYKREHPNAE